VLVNPLGPGSDPRRLIRLLRVPVLGEVAMGSINRRSLGRAIQRASSEAAWPPERLAAVWTQFDQGTQRALLRLARVQNPPPAPSPQIPVTLVQGGEDPWSAPAHWQALLPDAERLTLPGTRHWPWLESEAAAERIAATLA
jgi:pimeloyl-ACP methyl ester carboxylesterase